MLTTPTPSLDLKPGWAAEQKWDGFRALIAVDAGQVVVRSRRGTAMGPSFPEVVAGAVQLPDATALDGELIVWDTTGRLAFERLQNRLARRGTGAARAAEEWPAHFVAFDLLRLSGTDTTSWPYQRRRAALESVFAARRLSAPWALCPSTTDPDTVREWLTWTSVGMEGLVINSLLNLRVEAGQQGGSGRQGGVSTGCQRGELSRRCDVGVESGRLGGLGGA
ncbi:hypothetical protein [Streptomyces sp. NPDC051554]|uniref:ATP-dependent DNA ligase n=1 Tax=Streptomyces sp. NPDC051554 TaxID=3365656 RepID=UPI00378FB102